MKSMRIIFSLVGVMCLLASAVNADDQAKSRTTIDCLNRAAMNREWAGKALLESAEGQRAEAAKITKELFETTGINATFEEKK